MKNLYVLFSIIFLLFITTAGRSQSGNALLFTDTDNIVVADGLATTAINNVTVELWVKWSGTSPGKNQMLIYNGADGTDGYGITIDNSSSDEVCLHLGTPESFISSGVTLSTGVWTHIALVRDNGNWKLYINGTATSVTSSTAPNTPTTNLKIGNNNAMGWGFLGTIDEVRVSTTARYTSNFTPAGVPFTTDGNTATLYHFDEGSGQSTADASTNGNDGRLGSTTGGDTNDPTWASSDAPLPVLLYAFKATRIGYTVHLDWVTSPIENREIFEIQRNLENFWQTVDIKYAFTNNQNKFNWSEEISNFTGSANELSYRIKYTDLNGHTAFSNIQTISLIVPESTMLGQNYPNPFNSSTIISYNLKSPGLVRMVIYNTLGETVDTPINTYKDSGEYSVTIDASELPGGVYFYKLYTNEKMVDMKKMILLK